MRARIRPYKASQEEAFLRSSWRNVLTQACDLTFAETEAGIRRLQDRILHNPRTQVLVAADADDDREVLGYAIITGDVLSMCITKRDYRRQGVLRALLQDAPDALRAYFPHPAMVRVHRVRPVALEPLALLDL